MKNFLYLIIAALIGGLVALSSDKILFKNKFSFNQNKNIPSQLVGNYKTSIPEKTVDKGYHQAGAEMFSVPSFIRTKLFNHLS